MLAILGPLAALMGLEMTSLKERLQRQAIVWGMLALLGLVAVTFLLVSLNSALTYSFGPVIAPLLIASAALLIGIVAYVVYAFQESASRHKEAERQHSAEMTALVTTAAITALPLILPTLKKVGLPAGAVAAALLSLMRAKSLKRDR